MFQLQDKLILGSGSPRRKQILEDAGFRFEVVVKNTDESHPFGLTENEIPVYISETKARAFEAEKENNIILTADTMVFLDGVPLGKPLGKEDALSMLASLSGKQHVVVTGVTILYKNICRSFFDRTVVFFDDICDQEIEHYVSIFKPFDKAGAYGVQDWLGMVAISKINGSFYNVMGLPIHLVYKHLKEFQSKIS